MLQTGRAHSTAVVLQARPLLPHRLRCCPPRSLASKSKSFSGYGPANAKAVAAAAAATGDASGTRPKPKREVHRNQVGVQLLDRHLHDQVFKNAAFPAPSAEVLRIAHDHLTLHGLYGQPVKELPAAPLDLPPLQGDNIDEHFHDMGRTFAFPYLSIAETNAARPLAPRPSEWLRDGKLRSGWTRFGADGTVRAVERPGNEEEYLSFDVETMPKLSAFPVMACAASHQAWYLWLSPWLLGESAEMDHLIRFGGHEAPRVVVGHNVGYDRARVLEEYSIMRTRNRFLDTMSLHIAVKGISSHQRPAWMAYKKAKELAKEKEAETKERKRATREFRQALHEQSGWPDIDIDELIAAADGEEAGDDAAANSTSSKRAEKAAKLWQDVTSANSLADVALLHCGIRLDKGVRDLFVDAVSVQDVLPKLKELIDYCATDVETTHEVFRKVFPAFREKCPSPVTFAGVLGMGNAFLPVDESWKAYLDSAERSFRDLESKVQGKLHALAQDAMERGTAGVSMDEALAASEKAKEELTGVRQTRQPGEEQGRRMWWQDDCWLGQLDWTPKTPRGVRRRKRPSSSLSSGESSRSPTPYRPRWYVNLLRRSPSGPLSARLAIVPTLLRMRWHGFPLFKAGEHGWVFVVDDGRSPPEVVESEGGHEEIHLPEDQLRPFPFRAGQRFFKLPRPGNISSQKTFSPLNRAFERAWREGRLTSAYPEALAAYFERDGADALGRSLREVAERTSEAEEWREDWALSGLDWSGAKVRDGRGGSEPKDKSDVADAESTDTPPAQEWWPKWYWDLHKPSTNRLQLTVRSRVAPLLFKLTWLGKPLVHSRQYGWIYRVDATELDVNGGDFTATQKPLEFFHGADFRLRLDAERGGVYFKLPHKDGEEANVGTPLSKAFLKYFEEKKLKSQDPAAERAMELNATCSYWIMARERIQGQMVVWDDPGGRVDMNWKREEREGGGGGGADIKGDAVRTASGRLGMILPQIITMGTVTRRAIEKTWLTAANAKKTRVGSELKAMVRAPPGYSIVGADVDSEELWICSVMGDAQFGVHGATAIGWMTLEGSKGAGTDLHSKTASILGISRDQAKVFNYSRIYGAGVRHAVQLLLQANPGMTTEEATRLAKELYKATKGMSTGSTDHFGRKFWFGGSESFVFNKLEGIATSDEPRTPALGCGVTQALSKEFLPKEGRQDFMPSRINWAVQSSGVDYLHLLIVAMEHLIRRYGIEARYMLSVHDEVRYLSTDADRYRTALALQIANLWTRALFAYKLEMNDLPQSCAFFSLVDIDWCLRKETNMTCETPSHRTALAPGESLDMQELLAKLDSLGQSLGEPVWEVGEEEKEKVEYRAPRAGGHRASHAFFLRAQATQDEGEVKRQAKLYRQFVRAEKAEEEEGRGRERERERGRGGGGGGGGGERGRGNEHGWRRRTAVVREVEDDGHGGGGGAGAGADPADGWSLQGWPADVDVEVDVRELVGGAARVGA